MEHEAEALVSSLEATGNKGDILQVEYGWQEVNQSWERAFCKDKETEGSMEGD